MNKVQVFKSIAALAVFLLFAASAHAAKAMGPYETVRETTAQVLSAVKSVKSQPADQRDEAFSKEVGRILDGVVDFESFTRGVMGPFGSKAYYESLDSNEQKARLQGVIDSFTAKLRTRLISTITQGLLLQPVEDIQVVPLDKDTKLRGLVNVEQRINPGSGASQVVVYSLRKDRDGQWRVRNVTLNGVSVGRTYRAQFESARKRHDNDLERVVREW